MYKISVSRKGISSLQLAKQLNGSEHGLGDNFLVTF